MIHSGSSTIWPTLVSHLLKVCTPPLPSVSLPRQVMSSASVSRVRKTTHHSGYAGITSRWFTRDSVPRLSLLSWARPLLLLRLISMVTLLHSLWARPASKTWRRVLLMVRPHLAALMARPCLMHSLNSSKLSTKLRLLSLPLLSCWQKLRNCWPCHSLLLVLLLLRLRLRLLLLLLRWWVLLKSAPWKIAR